MERAFLSSTNRLKQLRLLIEIERNSELTQKELGKLIGAAPSMVNLYLNDFEDKGYIKKEQISPKNIKYRVTKEGLTRKDYLLVDYIHEILGLYDTARVEIEKYIRSLQKLGLKKIILYGSGVVANTFLWVLRDAKNSGLSVSAVVDDDDCRIGDFILDKRVESPEIIGRIPHDAVLITAYGMEEKISARLKKRGYRGKIMRFFEIKDID